MSIWVSLGKEEALKEGTGYCRETERQKVRGAGSDDDDGQTDGRDRGRGGQK